MQIFISSIMKFYFKKIVSTGNGKGAVLFNVALKNHSIKLFLKININKNNKLKTNFKSN